MPDTGGGAFTGYPHLQRQARTSRSLSTRGTGTGDLDTLPGQFLAGLFGGSSFETPSSVLDVRAPRLNQARDAGYLTQQALGVAPAAKVAALGINTMLKAPPVLAGSRAAQRGAVKIGSETPPELATDLLWSVKDKNRFAEPSSTDLRALQRSIEAYGVKKPVTLTASLHDQKAYLTDGNNRVAAAKLSNLPTVPYRVETTDVPFTPAQLAKARAFEELGLPADLLLPRSPNAEGAAANAWLKQFLGNPSRGPKLSQKVIQTSGREPSDWPALEKHFSEGGRVYAVHEQDGVPSEILNIEDLQKWALDQLLIIPK